MDYFIPHIAPIKMLMTGGCFLGIVYPHDMFKPSNHCGTQVDLCRGLSLQISLVIASPSKKDAEKCAFPG
jgi:hypothetical protein